MGLDWRNDNTIRWLLQGNIVKTIRELSTELAPQGGIATGDDVAMARADVTELRDEILAAAGAEGDVTDYLLSLNAAISSIVGENTEDNQSGMMGFLGKYGADYHISAKGVQGFWQLMEAVQNEQINALTTLNGEIRLGIIRKPNEGDVPAPDEIGIVIGQKVSFTDEVWNDDRTKLTYYEIAEKQTYAFYTSTGWQFWIDGNKVGWYDALNGGTLHITQAQVEDNITFGKLVNGENKTDWLITDEAGWGIRYLGG